MSVLDREYLDKIQEEGSLAESATDVNYHTARKIQKEVENLLRNDHEKNVRRGCKRISGKHAQKNRK